LASLGATSVAADDYVTAIRSYLDTDIRGWAADPRLAEAVAAQNVVTAGHTQADIDRLDETWRAEVGAADSALIASVLDNPSSEFLRQQVEAAGGTITEIFVMDARGLNVASSSLTSDYWQGDEEKFTETFPRGADAVHISEVEHDESTQTFQAQVSLPLTDPATGEVIGAMTVGLDAERLF
jgi:hypothetical protein